MMSTLVAGNFESSWSLSALGVVQSSSSRPPVSSLVGFNAK